MSFSLAAGIVLGGVSPSPGGGSSNGEVSVVEAREASGGTWYDIKLFIRQPWFIGTVGAVAWIILLIVVLLLYRQRRNKKKSQKALSTRGDFLVLLCCSVVCFHTVPHTCTTGAAKLNLEVYKMREGRCEVVQFRLLTRGILGHFTLTASFSSQVYNNKWLPVNLILEE